MSSQQPGARRKKLQQRDFQYIYSHRKELSKITEKVVDGGLLGRNTQKKMRDFQLLTEQHTTIQHRNFYRWKYVYLQNVTI